MKAGFRLRARSGVPAAMLILAGPLSSHAADATPGGRLPVIGQPAVTIAGNPDLGDLTTPNQQPVDFAIWQAADGTWQLLSCIRNTKEPGNTRLLYRWEGAHLTDPDWTPMGIAMHADTSLGETTGGLQAPYVFRVADGAYEMFFGSWDNICSAQSRDGKTFARQLNSAGKSTLFGGGKNPRDPVVLRVGGLWHCYYTAHPDERGADYCRTSPDLTQWSDARIVARGGQAGTGPYSAECPFVLELAPGQFYLFRTQRYGTNAQTSVYFSIDPFDFGIDQDAGHFVCTLPIAAPEIICQPGGFSIAYLRADLRGIQISTLDWTEAP